MTPSARRAKPSSVDEIARVIRIYDLLSDELSQRMTPKYWDGSPLTMGRDTEITYGPVTLDILNVADRIAARTEG